MCLIRNPRYLWKLQSTPSSWDSNINVNMAMQIADNLSHSRAVSSAQPTDALVPRTGGAYNLFKSSRGIGLPVEVCLKIVEDVVDVEPKYARALMCLSKVSFAFILTTGAGMRYKLAVSPFINNLPAWPFCFCLFTQYSTASFTILVIWETNNMVRNSVH